jgi:opacity protein-like surface antigen
MKYGIACLAVATAFSSMALAQETKPLGVSIKVGQFSPSSRAGKEEGKGWISFGIDTKIKDMRFDKGRGEYLTVSADFFQKGDLRSVPVTLNWVSRTNEWYVFGGAGVSFTQDYRIVGLDRESEDSIELAYVLGVGYDFQYQRSPLFGEVRFHGNGNDRLNGFSIAVGLRL